MVFNNTSFHVSPILLKNCQECNAGFTSKYKFQIYCSKKCKSKSNERNRYNNPIRKSKMKIRNLRYYHDNKNKIIARQVLYKMNKYKTDLEFRKKDNIRKLATHHISLKDKKCNVCLTDKDLQRHHPDYSKPLEVIILCRRCHNNVHHDDKLLSLKGEQKDLNSVCACV